MFAMTVIKDISGIRKEFDRDDGFEVLPNCYYF